MLDGLLLDRPVDLTYLSAASNRAGTPPRGMRVHALAVVLHRASVYFIVDLLAAETGARVQHGRLMPYLSHHVARAASRARPRHADARTRASDASFSPASRARS